MSESINYVKNTINAIKAWFEKNGVTGIGGLIAGVLLFMFGYKFYSGIAFGVFATRNWDIIVEYIKTLLTSEKEEKEETEK